MKILSVSLLGLAAWQTASFAQPVITRQPSNQTASLFADVSFSLLVSGDPPLSFQWRLNNAGLVGMTNRNLAVTNVQHSSAGNYDVIVSNPSGSVTSQVATLTIKPFNSAHFFGYSWTDTRGILPDGSTCAWFGSPQFYMNRACNGPMWPEFLSAELGLAYVPANNYAYCGATLQQIEDQVKRLRVPTKPQLSLYFLWARRTDVPSEYEAALTNQALAMQLNQADALFNSNIVNLLYGKGARSIVIQNLNGTILPGDAADLGTNAAAVQIFEQTFLPTLRQAMNSFSRTHPDVRITFVDVSSKLNEVVAEPALYGFTKTDIGAVEDNTLTDKSFTGPGANYVYWNKRHGTSKVHQLIAAWTLDELSDAILEELQATPAGESVRIQMNHLQIGRDYTLQKSLDLANWDDVGSFTASAGTNFWSSASALESIAYFRLKW